MVCRRRALGAAALLLCCGTGPWLQGLRKVCPGAREPGALPRCFCLSLPFFSQVFCPAHLQESTSSCLIRAQISPGFLSQGSICKECAEIWGSCGEGDDQKRLQNIPTV